MADTVKNAMWESLPPAVLGRILLTWSDAPRAAKFATCKCWCQAILCGAQHLVLLPAAFTHPPVRVLRLAAQLQCTFSLRLNDYPAYYKRKVVSTAALFTALRDAKVSLSEVHQLVLMDCKLDAPSGAIATVLPNLQDVKVEECEPSASSAPLAHCQHLQRFTLAPTAGKHTCGADQWRSLLEQLADLPKLDALTLQAGRYPTDFLPRLKDQLTYLSIAWWNAEAEAMQRGMHHVGQVTTLRKLELAHCSGKAMGELSRLTALESLKLSFCGEEDESFEDGVKGLLGCNRLHSLNWWQDKPGHLNKSYTDQESQITLLTLVPVSPQVLARLPLHNLRKLQFYGVYLGEPVTVEDVQAVVDLARRNKMELELRQNDDNEGEFFIELGFAKEQIDCWYPGEQRKWTLELLKAAAPLVPPNFKRMAFNNVRLDAEVVTAIHHMLDNKVTITSLTIQDSFILPCAWQQLGRCFPGLQHLDVHDPVHLFSPIAVMGYYSVVHSAIQGAKGDAEPPRGADIFACKEAEELTPELVDWESSFTAVNEQLEMMGIKARVQVDVYDSSPAV